MKEAVIFNWLRIFQTLDSVLSWCMMWSQHSWKDGEIMPRRSTTATIHAQIKMLEKQAKKLEMSATKGLRAAAKVIAKHGLSMSDLKEAFSLSRGKGKGSTARSKVAIKYSDGGENTWTGRGRTPLWLVAAEKAGKKRESFLVGAAKPKAKPKRSKAAVKKAAPAPLQTAA